MKKVITLLMAIVLVLGVVGCSQAPDSSSAVVSNEVPVEKIKIAWSLNAMDEAKRLLLNHAQKYCDDNNIELIYTEAQGVIDKQIADLESLMVQEPDVILISPLDADALIPTVDAISAAGIPIVTYTSFINSDKVTVHCNTDYIAYAMAQVDFHVKYLEENPDVTLNMGILDGPAGLSHIELMHKTIKENLIDKYPDRINFLSRKACDWVADKAAAATEDWLVAFPEINCIIGMNGEMAVASVRAIEAAGRDPRDFLITGRDGTVAELEAIRQGVLAGTATNNRRASVYKVMETCAGLAQGKTYEAIVPVGQIGFITPENIEEMIVEYELK